MTTTHTTPLDDEERRAARRARVKAQTAAERAETRRFLESVEAPRRAAARALNAELAAYIATGVAALRSARADRFERFEAEIEAIRTGAR